MIKKILNFQFSLFNFKISGNEIMKHPLFSGSAIMIIGSNFANFIAYLYHLIIGRLLGPASYGELSAIISVLALFFTSFSFLGLVIVKFVSSAKKNSLNSIYTWFTKKAFYFGLIVSGLVLAGASLFSDFLHINLSTFLLIVPILAIAVVGFVYRSFLQGLLKFKEVVFASNLDFIVRLILGVFFIYLGFSVFGVVLGMLFSTLASFLLLRFYLKDFRLVKKDTAFSLGKKVFNYAIPMFVSTLAINSMISTDVVLVKHFFSSHDAGIYASISTLGKIIFYGAGPVGGVMFPLVSQKHSKGLGSKKIFFLSLLLTSAIAAGVLFIYWLFPDFSIRILFGSKFLEGKSYLLLIGVFMTIYTLASLVLSYFLSKEKTKVVLLALVAAILQGVGIWFFHSTITTVIKVSIATSSLFLFSMLLYFGYEEKSSKIA